LDALGSGVSTEDQNIFKAIMAGFGNILIILLLLLS